MNALEMIAIEKLRAELANAADRVSDKNKDRLQHEQLFIQSSLDRCFSIIKALEDNQKTQFQPNN